MSEAADWSLIARYLSDECSMDERDKVEAWVASNPENQRMLEFMKVVWRVSEARAETSDVKKLWDDVAVKAGITANPEVKKNPEALKLFIKTIKWPARLHADNYRLLRYAAIFLVVFTLGYFFTKMDAFLPWGQSAKLITMTVEKGDREKLTLGDGTNIVLDAGSSLRYPKRFKGETREIFLNGEGYFEVAPDAEKPFIVHANHAVIRVLGTKFNVRAWQPDRRVTVAVAEGTVSLRSGEDTTQAAVVIKKGQVSRLPLIGQPSAPRPVDVNRYLGWMQNEVFFEDAPLREILFQLERWYDVQFVLEDSSAASERLNLHFQNESIDDVLKLISALTDLQYRRTGKAIQLTL